MPLLFVLWLSVHRLTFKDDGRDKVAFVQEVPGPMSKSGLLGPHWSPWLKISTQQFLTYCNNTIALLKFYYCFNSTRFFGNFGKFPTLKCPLISKCCVHVFWIRWSGPFKRKDFFFLWVTSVIYGERESGWVALKMCVRDRVCDITAKAARKRQNMEQ